MEPRDTILTDENGRPFPKPTPEDFESAVEYVRAMHAYHDKVRDAAVQAFEESLRAALRAP